MPHWDRWANYSPSPNHRMVGHGHPGVVKSIKALGPSRVKVRGVLDPKFVESRALMETYLKGQGGATQWDSEGSRTTGRPSQASMANNIRIVDFRSE